jgi:predicted acyltransferase
MGLLLEPYEGGIKKDPSTFSYYFICSALAFLLLPLLLMLLEMRIIGRMLGFLSDVGKNPMLAYVAGALLILPILSLTGLKSYWESLTQTPLQGFGKGLLFTTAVVLITRFSVKKKWFWKT